MLKSPNSILLSEGGGFEPLQVNRFACQFFSPDGAMPQDANILVRQLQVPEEIVDSGNFQFMNRNIKYPLAKAQFGDASLGIMLTAGKKTMAYKFFRKWFEKVYDEDSDEVGLVIQGGGVGGTAEVSILDPDGSAAFTIQMADIWPNRWQFSEFNYDTDVPVVIRIGFAVNSVKFEP